MAQAYLGFLISARKKTIWNLSELFSPLANVFSAEWWLTPNDGNCRSHQSFLFDSKQRPDCSEKKWRNIYCHQNEAVSGFRNGQPWQSLPCQCRQWIRGRGIVFLNSGNNQNSRTTPWMRPRPPSMPASRLPQWRLAGRTDLVFTNTIGNTTNTMVVRCCCISGWSRLLAEIAK